MKALILTTLLFLLAIVTGCGGTKNVLPKPAPVALLYAVGPGSNNIVALEEKDTGALSPLPVSFFSTNPRPVALALHPSKNFVYVANATSNTVSGFSLDHQSGVLTPVGTALPPTPVGVNPVSLGINSSGQFLFVLNQGTVVPPAPATISVLSIDPVRGTMTEISGSPFPTVGSPLSMAVSPTAGFLYVGNGALGTISIFSIGASGALTPVGAPVAAGTTIAGITIDPKNQFLFAADSGNDGIVSFNIQASGALTPVAGSPFSTGAGTKPVSIAVDSTSAFLYSANQGTSNVSGFKLSSGALTQVSGSPYTTQANGVTTATTPAFVTVDVTNAFVYVGNQGTSAVAAFSMKSTDGTLTAVAGSPFSQLVGPVWIVTTK
jgi:6-phosphogluconolactonase (cycloisomerase 2 family)